IYTESAMPRIVATVVTLAFISPAFGQNPAINELDVLLQDIQTMSAKVLQLIIESDGGVLEESEIQMHLKNPDGFYWETIDPFPELIVTNGTYLWNYQPDLEQVVIENWDNNKSELASQIINGLTENIAEDYLVQLISDDESSEFELTPIALDSVFELITIRFIASNLDMIHLDNKNGEQTVWQFRNIEKNQSLSDTLFVFEPPDGVDVIENTTN
ncbi:MAG: outer membrane lipoprotein chaperone LolA, partial [Pseudomonadales bacterium]|nr:outer membrane lipoprotein chaperone LolA [Pseudomonadales bacterium]